MLFSKLRSAKLLALIVQLLLDSSLAQSFWQEPQQPQLQATSSFPIQFRLTKSKNKRQLQENDESVTADNEHRHLVSFWNLLFMLTPDQCPPGPLGKPCRDRASSSGGSSGSGSSSGSSGGGSSGGGSSGSGSSSGGGGGSSGGSSGGGSSSGGSSGGGGSSSGGSGGSGGSGSGSGGGGGSGSGGSYSGHSDSSQHSDTGVASRSSSIVLLIVAAVAAAVAVAAVVVGQRRTVKRPHPLTGSVARRMGLFGQFANSSLCNTERPQRVVEMTMSKDDYAAVV